jgi:hypothetical protein
MSALKTIPGEPAPGTTDRARPGRGAARPGHGSRRRHGRIHRARRLPRPRPERRDRAAAVHRRVRLHHRPHTAAAKGREQLAIGLLFGLGLLLGLAVAPVIADYADAGTLFWALLGLTVFGIVAIFVSIPNSNLIYAVAGLGIFGAFTIFDFNRLRRSTPDAAVPIAAAIFLDIFNIFLLALSLFGGGRRD